MEVHYIIAFYLFILNLLSKNRTRFLFFLTILELGNNLNKSARYVWVFIYQIEVEMLK